MNKKCLVIFPTQLQVKIWQRYVHAYGLTVYILLSHQVEIDSQSNLHFITEEDVVSLSRTRLKVFCCSEAAIYWLKNHMSIFWQLQFMPEYLQMLNKIEFKQYAINKKLPVLPFWLKSNELNEFPVIGKPSFGFASSGVSYLKDAIKAEEYERNFNDVIKESPIEKYRRIYFSDYENKCIFEPYIDGDFYRTPFVIDTCGNIITFPLRGIKRHDTSSKGFHWTDFICEDNCLELHALFNKILTQVENVFHLLPGVYIAEFIVRKDKIYLVEFSPRLISDRLAWIVKAATGVDLEDLASALFIHSALGIKINGIQKKFDIPERRVVRLQIIDSSSQIKSLDGFKLLETKQETNAYGKKVSCNLWVWNGEKIETE